MFKPLSYYLGLVTSEYQNSPKFLAWLTAGLNKLIDGESTANSIISAFDLDTAIGVQLDVLGVILGQSRTINFQPTDGSSPTLSDDNYRVLLKAKIILNQWNGTTTEVINLWKIIFPNVNFIITDNQNMTMNVVVGGISSQVIKDLIINGYIIPKPQGVGINYLFIGDQKTPFFGYGLDNDYVSGYNKGIWIGEPIHPEFAYDEDSVNYSGYDKGYWKS